MANEQVDVSQALLYYGFGFLSVPRNHLFHPLLLLKKRISVKTFSNPAGSLTHAILKDSLGNSGKSCAEMNDDSPGGSWATWGVCLHTLTGFQGQHSQPSSNQDEPKWLSSCLFEKCKHFWQPQVIDRRERPCKPGGQASQAPATCRPHAAPGAWRWQRQVLWLETGCDGCCVPNSGVGRKKLERNWFLLVYKNECSTQGSQNG